MKDLQEIRQALDQVDKGLVHLFEQRMELCRQVAATKIEIGMPVLDRTREEAVLKSRADMAQDSYWAKDVRELYQCIMALSRREQERMVKEAEGND